MAYHHALYENRRKIKNQHAVVPEKPAGCRKSTGALATMPITKASGWCICCAT